MLDDLTVCTPLPRYLPFPKFLPHIKLSHTAKLLYALLLDRATLSRKNNWTDEQGRIYVIYPIPKLAQALGCSFSRRNAVVDRLCRFPLLIIDDFGMERGTEYALEQVYNIVDSRYRSRKPLIVTTNLTLDEIRHPQDTAHARIYDRILEMCVPVSCIGASLRKENAQKKPEYMKLLIG